MAGSRIFDLNIGHLGIVVVLTPINCVLSSQTNPE